MKKTKKQLIELGVFIIVGVINTVVDFVVFNLFILFFSIKSGFWIIPIVIISFISANINSYYLNKNWTFKKSNNSPSESKKITFSKFLFISLIGLSINIIVVLIITTYIKPFLNLSFIIILVDNLGWNVAVTWANIAKLSAITLSMTWNYIGYKFIVFK